MKKIWFGAFWALLLIVACSGANNATNGGSESCSAGAPCGTGGDIQTCTTRDSAGACTSVVYRLAQGRAFTCTSCTDCGRTVADVTSACGPGTVVPGGDAGGSSGGSSSGCVGSACNADGGPVVACKAGNDACNNGNDCCSNRCVVGKCDPCAAAGEACVGTTCCANASPHLTCFKGACSACLGGGAACKTTTDCCSQTCTGGTCEAPVACKVAGGACQKADECCDVAAGCNVGTCGCNVTQSLPSKIPSIPPSCVAATQASCCSQGSACVNDAGCVTYVNCLIACGQTNAACRQTCQTNAPPASQTIATTFGTCLAGAGASACIP